MIFRFIALASLLWASTVQAAPTPLFDQPERSSIVKAQMLMSKKELSQAQRIIDSMSPGPLKQWANSQLSILDSSPPSTLERLAKLQAGSLMEKRLLEKSAWLNYQSGEPNKANDLLSRYSFSNLSGGAKCTSILIVPSKNMDMLDLVNLLSTSLSEESCQALFLKRSENSASYDLLMAALTQASSSSKRRMLDLLYGQKNIMVTDGSLLLFALKEQLSPSTLQKIPDSYPLLKMALWNLYAQQAFNKLELSALDAIPIVNLQKNAAWSYFRLALFGNDLPAQAKALQRLSEIDKENSRFLFWDRILTGSKISEQELLKRNNYHAFVLRRALGQPLFYKTPLTKRVEESCESDAATTAIALFKAGSSSEAFQAWRFVLQRGKEGTQRCLAQLALRHQAIPLMLMASNSFMAQDDADLDMQWMIGERDALAKAANSENISFTLFSALSRQESRFDPHAISVVGAMGLTQLMPSTAADLVRKEGFIKPNLLDPFDNAKLGARYFQQRLQKLQDPRWASSAYNAGERRAIAWKQRYGTMPWIVGVELIPFEETRGYVEKIYEGWAAHAMLSKESIDPLSLAAASTGIKKNN